MIWRRISTRCGTGARTTRLCASSRTMPATIAGENRPGAGRGRCHFRRSWYSWRDSGRRKCADHRRTRRAMAGKSSGTGEDLVGQPAGEAAHGEHRLRRFRAAYRGHGARRARPMPRTALRPVMSHGAARSSVALMLGVGVWGYRLAVRDVHGRAGDPGAGRAERGSRRRIRAANQARASGLVGQRGRRPRALRRAPPEQMALAPRPVDLTTRMQPTAAPHAGCVPPIRPRGSPTRRPARRRRCRRCRCADDAARRDDPLP